MLYTVHTTFTARDKNTGFLRRCCRTDKVEVPDGEKELAKYRAWKQISDCEEYEFLRFESQNARASHRK